MLHIGNVERRAADCLDAPQTLFSLHPMQVQAMMDLQHKVSQRPGERGLNLLLDDTVEHEELQELRPYEAWLEMPVKAK